MASALDSLLQRFPKLGSYSVPFFARALYEDNFENVPSKEGVIQLLNDEKDIYHIKGSDNMKETLLEKFNNGEKAAYFIYEADPMFTKRESELLQQYLQKHGKLPNSGDDLDDLF